MIVGSEEMAVMTLHVRRRQRLWLVEHRQLLKKGMEGVETRAAKLMHVTSMRPRRKKLGTGSAPHATFQYLRAPTPVVAPSFHPVCSCFTATLQHPQLFCPNVMTPHKVHSHCQWVDPNFKLCVPVLLINCIEYWFIGRVRLAVHLKHSQWSTFYMVI